ncbi:hypothetical protein MP213Fo_18430 [Pseudochrobactrum sp. MP213Fo]
MVDRIDAFRERAVEGIPDGECVSEVSNLFGESYSFDTALHNYKAGTTFYRARAIPDDDTLLPLRTMSQVGDAWEPPAHVVKQQGRLNACGQSILYCCADDPQLAINEARARFNKHIAIIVYKAKRPINFSIIGGPRQPSKIHDPRSNLFYSFMEDEFSIFVSQGEEGRYSITRAIADTFYNYPEQDAWCYRSVQSNEKFNTAFLPGKSKGCLSLSGVMICNLQDSLAQSLSVKLVVDFDGTTGCARYHKIGSLEQKSIFPEIS